MKLSDVIDYKHSLWNALGKTGGSALPYNGNHENIKGVDVWKRKTRERIDEVGGGRGGGQQSITPHFDLSQHPDIDKINGIPEPSMDEPDEFDNWASPPKDGESFMVVDPQGRNRKVMIRKVGQDSVEAMDDEGNHFIPSHTGPIDHKRMHTGHSDRSAGSDVRGRGVNERAMTGTGLGGTGATQRPAPGPAELEYDLDYIQQEFKGKDTRGDIKTNKKERETLKQYLKKRTGRRLGN